MTAQEQRKYKNLTEKLIRIEERSKLLKNLIRKGVGLKDEEEFMKYEEGKFKGKQNFKKKEIITRIMEIKLKDNNRWGTKVRRLRNVTKKKIEERIGTESEEYKDLIKETKNMHTKLRPKLREKFKKKEIFLTNKYRPKIKMLEELNTEDKKTYGRAQIYDDDCNYHCGICPIQILEEL